MGTDGINARTKNVSSRFERYLAKLDELERNLDEFEKSEIRAREELYSRVSQILSDQREEIVRLRKEISNECQQERLRRAKARRQFLSE